MLIHHKIMLEDRVRCHLYQRAIQEVVKPGDVVCDLGTGSGLLAFFAVQAGAGKVYAIERADIIEDAKRIARENGWSKKIIFMKGISTKVNLPEKVDVVVSEIFGSFALEEDLPKYIIDAKKRFLKKGGVLIPSYLEMFIAPVEAPGIYRSQIKFWSKKLYGIDFSTAKEEAVNHRYINRIDSKYLLAKAHKIYNLNFYKINNNRPIYVDKSTKFIIEKKGCLQGLAGWFQAQLSDKILLSTSPKDKPTHWRNNFFPFQESVLVSKGDTLNLRFTTRPMFNQPMWAWKADVLKRHNNLKRTKTIKFSHSTFKAIPLSRQMLLGSSLDSIPILDKEARIKLFILQACNGRDSITGIAKKLILRYPKNYRTLKEAISKVRQITRDCQILPVKRI